jgi:hypothetical protein
MDELLEKKQVSAIIKKNAEARVIYKQQKKLDL